MIKLSRLFPVALAGAMLLIGRTPADAQKLAPLPNFQADWVRDYPPFRLVGNLYYVGSYDLACYLITTPKGDILINAGVPGSDTLIRRHIEALGFKFSDLKILLTNQAHFDHVGAMAAIRKHTGAKIMIDEKDAPVLEDGGNSDFIFGGNGPLFEPVSPDRLLHDRDTIKLGGMDIVLLHHPGHTKGSCSFLFDVKDNQSGGGAHSYRVLIANIPSILDQTKFPRMPGYPTVMDDYAFTLDTMPKIHFDLWFAAHASQFNLHVKHQPGDPYNPLAFADRAGYDAAIRDQQRVFAAKASAAAQ
jgi:metallo-beta-lactamase class B